MLRYFGSGWAFLVPYILAYLTYLALSWPVNPASAVSVTLPAETDHQVPPAVPCLLHVYWALHLFHFGGFLIAFLSYLRLRRPQGHIEQVWRCLPWLLVATLLGIAGPYLEYPADPWEHIDRIREWHDLSIITEHRAWTKASYLFVYSILSATPPSWASSVMAMYIATVGTILAWNAHRLGLSIGLGRPAAIAFALLQSSLLGNSAFSFSRYYGLSSTIIAQLASFALLRVAIDSSDLRLCDVTQRRTIAAGKVLCCTLLVAIIGLHHLQGIAVVVPGLLAIAAWRAVRWRSSSALIVILGIALAANILGYSLYVSSDLLQHTPQPQAYMTSFGSFDVFRTGSPAQERALQILGFVGLCSIIAGFPLVARNRLAGWLTLAPVAALAMPVFSAPLAWLMVDRQAESIAAFHRVLFGVPSGLAIIALVDEWRASRLSGHENCAERRALTCWLPLGLVAICVLAALPPGRPFYNRLWNMIAITPKDLTMRSVTAEASILDVTLMGTNPYVLGTSGNAFVVQAQTSNRTPFDPSYMYRLYRTPLARSPSDDLAISASYLQNPLRPSVLLVVTDPMAAVSASSQAACASEHWLAQEVALASSGSAELESLAARTGRVRQRSGAILSAFY